MERKKERKKKPNVFLQRYIFCMPHISILLNGEKTSRPLAELYGISHISPSLLFFHPVSLIPVYENTTRTVEKLDAPAACVCVAFYVGLLRAIVKAIAEQSLLLPIYIIISRSVLVHFSSPFSLSSFHPSRLKAVMRSRLLTGSCRVSRRNARIYTAPASTASSLCHLPSLVIRVRGAALLPSITGLSYLVGRPIIEELRFSFFVVTLGHLL